MMATDGNNSAAQDMATRAKIANFPPEVFDPQILSKATGELSLACRQQLCIMPIQTRQQSVVF